MNLIVNTISFKSVDENLMAALVAPQNKPFQEAVDGSSRDFDVDEILEPHEDHSVSPVLHFVHDCDRRFLVVVDFVAKILQKFIEREINYNTNDYKH